MVSGLRCDARSGMLKVAAKAAGDYRLYLRFEDCVEGVADLAPHLFRGVFEPLRGRGYFVGFAWMRSWVL